MPRLTQACIDAVRHRADLIDVAGDYTSLKRAGSQWRGLSPFNPEKTPSFFVHPEKQLFMDYSSGYGGDVFRFLEFKENLTFGEAIEVLAQRYGIPLEYEAESGGSQFQPSVRTEILKLHERATAFFAEAFFAASPEGEQIREYWLAKRGFTLEHARSFEIGLSPTDGFALYKAIRNEGFSREALEASGIFYVYPDDLELRKVRCRFRGRLMIPIHDVQGRVCAFTARQTALTPQDDPQYEAKYVNSTETPIFTKKRMVFNLHRARTAIKEAGAFLLVEGQLDALRCTTAGLVHTVAPQGSNVTDEQLALLRRYSRRLEVLLDGDRAGRDAAFKLLPRALAAGLDVSFLPLPDGADPDDLVREHGREAVEGLRAQGLTAMELAVKHLLPEAGSMPALAKAAALEQLYEILRPVESSVARAEMLGEVARIIHTKPEQLQQDAARQWRKVGRTLRNARPPTPTGANETHPAGEDTPLAIQPGTKLLSAEEELLILGLNHSDFLRQEADNLDSSWPDTTSTAGRLLAQMLLDQEEGVWDGVTDFLERLENPSVRDYARQLVQMGASLLDFRCDGAFLRRGHSPNGMDTSWEPSETIAILSKILHRRYIERETRRLDALFLNTPDNEVEKRRELLEEKKRLRNTL